MENNDKREYGIDILRIISMFMITILHTLNRGGVLYSIKYQNVYNAAYFLDIMAFCSVNIYALISGYVGVTSKFKISRILYIYLEVIFYTITLYFIYKGNHPELVTDECIEKTFMPIYNGHYWYITAYIGLYFLSPILNYGLNNIPKRIIKPILYIMILLYIIIPEIIDKTQFGIGYGYTMPWLLVLYIFGGYIKLYNPFESFRKMDFLITYLLATFIEYLSHITKTNVFSLSYTSILMFIQGVSLLVLGSKINVRSKIGIKIISVMSKLTLGVYIIHINWFVWRVQVLDFAVGIGNETSIIIAVLKIFYYALKIFIPCMIVDLIRYYLFELLRIRKLLSKIDNIFKEKPEKYKVFIE